MYKIINLNKISFSNLLRKTNKLVACIISTLILLTGSLAFTGSTSYVRNIDASLGLLNRNHSSSFNYLQEKIKQNLLEGTGSITTSAFLGGIGNIFNPVKAAITAAFRAILSIVFDILNSIYDSIIQPIVDLLNGLLSFVDDFLNALDKLVTVLSGTRAAIGFLIYRDIEGAGNDNTANFLSAKGVVNFLLNRTQQATKTELFPTNFEDRDVMVNTLVDAVAWLDFMNVQRYMQYDLIGDNLANNFGMGLENFDNMKYHIQDAILARKCERNNIVLEAPILRDFIGYRPCEIENREIVTYLDKRQEQVFRAVRSKVAQYESTSPSDCKGRQYFDVDGSFNINYDANNPGNLGQLIAQESEKITKMDIRPEECEYAKTLKRDGFASISEMLQPVNLLASFQNPQAFIQAVGTFFQGFFEDMITSIKDRFDNLFSMIEGFNAGAGVALYGALLDITLNIKSDISNNLDDIANRYNEYVEGQRQGVENQVFDEFVFDFI